MVEVGKKVWVHSGVTQCLQNIIVQLSGVGAERWTRGGGRRERMEEGEGGREGGKGERERKGRRERKEGGGEIKKGGKDEERKGKEGGGGER